VAEHDISEQQAAEVFDELRVFLLACSLANATLLPSRPVDEAWHTFILHTQDYRSWCQESFGRFLDHHPLRTVETGRVSPSEYWTGLNHLRKIAPLRDHLWVLGAWSTGPTDTWEPPSSK
jgi:hypothetical protein